MKKLNLLFLVLLLTVVCGYSQEKRIALVVGNSNYQHGGKLKNPVNDANLMAKTLTNLGFEVTKLTDANLKELQNASIEFTEKIKNYDVALFYYAGHGIQVDGTNYLLPIDAQLEQKLSVRYEAFNISDINYAFQQNNSKMNIMILDACRDNPFRSWNRGNTRGFKAINDQASGTIIAFATREGETAADGTGNNGLYTAKLVEQMQISQSLSSVFKNTRVAVLKASGEKQCPQEWDMTTNEFYFAGKSNYSPKVEVAEQPAPQSYGTLKLTTYYTGTVKLFTLSGSLLESKYVKEGYIYTFRNIPTGVIIVHIYSNSGASLWQKKVSINTGTTSSLTTDKPQQEATGNNPNYPEMVKIPCGTFQMGSNDVFGYSYDKPVHSVTISDFYIGKYEVTNEEYCCFLNDYGSDEVKSGEYSGQIMIYTHSRGVQKNRSKWESASGYDKYPVIYVTWYGANEYCKWLSRKMGKNYRLPTEAEWEYAAGGGSPHQKYAGTNNENFLGAYAWYYKNSTSYLLGSYCYDSNETHKVGTIRPNRYGLYDMSGNVWEWCSDWFESYSSSSQTNPQGASSGSHRVFRGGCWSNAASLCRVANRNFKDPTYSSSNLGFRIAADF